MSFVNDLSDRGRIKIAVTINPSRTAKAATNVNHRPMFKIETTSNVSLKLTS